MIRLFITIAFVLSTFNANMYRIQIEFEKFSHDNLYSYIVDLGVKYPDIVMAQARLESGHFTSIIFKENNNLFGMRYPKRRETVATGSNKGYAVYPNWKVAVMDYKLWQNRFIHKIDTKDEYLAYLSKNYAADSLYIQQLKIK